MFVTEFRKEEMITKRNILIVGGMGPQSSLLLHKRIIDKAVENGAVNGADFPTITHTSIPIDDFICDSTKLVQAKVDLRQSLGYLWRPEVHTCNNCL